ncbi:hypothetical protein [Albibacterium indicum]|uniref:hypothetical protein n=1 Tax=Albibacterium indicum TaxID=2292082 RepID=UPI000E47B746|nr:hypothetical protein [Pedobacter indicus]
MKHTWLLVVLFLMVNSLYSQDKFEKESRIKSSEVSMKATDYVESIFSGSQKIKWYLEENLEGMAVEAKIKENRTIYSIKFDTLGNLQDIEFIQRFDQLPIRAQQKITDYFQGNYDRYKIRKIQIQWIGDANLLRSVLLKETQSQQYEVNYEIVFSGRKDGDRQSYEAIFSDTGEHIKTKKIISRNLNHLIY